MTLVLDTGITGQTNTIELIPEAGGAIAQVVALVEDGTTGVYLGVPTNALGAGGYRPVAKTAGAEVNTDFGVYYWDGAKERTILDLFDSVNDRVDIDRVVGAAVTAVGDFHANTSALATQVSVDALPTVAPDNAGIGNLTAALASPGVFSVASLANAPTGTGGGSGLSTGQATQLSDLAAALESTGVFSTASLANGPSGGGGGGASLVDITTAINAARDVVTTTGNTSWATANTATLSTQASVNALSTAVGAIPTTEPATPAQVAAVQTAIITEGTNSWTTANTSAIATQASVTALGTSIAAIPTTEPATPAQVAAVTTAGDARWTTANVAGLATQASVDALPTVAPDNAGIGTLTALVSGGAFTTAALINAPTGTGGGSGLSTGQATQLSDIAAALTSPGVFSAASLVNSPSGGGGGASLIDITTAINAARDVVTTTGNTSWTTANTTALSTQASVNTLSTAVAAIPTTEPATPAQVTAVQTAIITTGDANWRPADVSTLASQASVNAIPTAGSPSTGDIVAALNPTLSPIASDCKIARQKLVNDENVNQTAATVATLEDDGATVAFTLAYSNDAGAATNSAATRRRSV